MAMGKQRCGMIELDDEARLVSYQGRSVNIPPLEYTFVKWMLEKQCG